MAEGMFLPVLKNEQSTSDEDKYYVTVGEERKYILPFGRFYRKATDPSDTDNIYNESGEEEEYYKFNPTDSRSYFKKINDLDRWIYQLQKQNSTELNENTQFFIHKDTLNEMLYGGGHKRTHRRRKQSRKRAAITKKRNGTQRRRQKRNRRNSRRS